MPVKHKHDEKHYYAYHACTKTSQKIILIPPPRAAKQTSGEGQNTNNTKANWRTTCYPLLPLWPLLAPTVGEGLTRADQGSPVRNTEKYW